MDEYRIQNQDKHDVPLLNVAIRELWNEHIVEESPASTLVVIELWGGASVVPWHSQNIEIPIMRFVFDPNCYMDSDLRLYFSMAQPGDSLFTLYQSFVGIAKSASDTVPENTSVLFLPPEGHIKKSIEKQLSTQDNKKYSCSLNPYDPSDASGCKIAKDDILKLVDGYLARTGIDSAQSGDVVRAATTNRKGLKPGSQFYLIERTAELGLVVSSGTIGEILSTEIRGGRIVPRFPTEIETEDVGFVMGQKGKTNWEHFADQIDPTWVQRFSGLVPVSYNNIEKEDGLDIAPGANGRSSVKMPDMSDSAMDEWWETNVAGLERNFNQTTD